MGLTPVEIHHVPLDRGVWGYRRNAVDRLLEEVAASYEEVWRGRAQTGTRQCSGDRDPDPRLGW